MYRKKFYFLLASGIYALILLILIRHITKKEHVTRRTTPPGRIRTILLWKQNSANPLWQLPSNRLGPDYFKEQKCRFNNCSITNSDKHFPFADSYDAVVFQIAGLENSIKNPTLRQPWQIYIFALHESPVHTFRNLKREGNFYNATMTYRLDSDIVWPHGGYMMDVETELIIAPRMSPAWREPPLKFYDAEVNSLLSTRTRLAAFVASDCGVFSQRDALVYQLQKYIKVDEFDKCRNVTCDSNTIECQQLLKPNYKFLLAFEDSLCQDYVTAKFYLAFDYSIVPVVFGGADYDRFAPLHSYIDAEKFENVEKLAEYLKYLDEHPGDYMRYFWWKRYYKLGQHSPFCELCEYLHSAAAKLRTQSYNDIEKWWFSDACHVKPEIFNPTVERPSNKMRSEKAFRWSIL